MNSFALCGWLFFVHPSPVQPVVVQPVIVQPAPVCCHRGLICRILNAIRPQPIYYQLVPAEEGSPE